MIKKPTKIVLCGYYGRGNLGDEMILESIIKQTKKAVPHANIQALTSKNPIVNARKMNGAELFVFGGGSILQNATSDASLLYYLAIIHLSNLLCKRKIMLSNGIGPIIERKISQKIIFRSLARAINCFDFVSVRDTASQKFLQGLLPHRKIHLAPDPALIEFANINQRLINLPPSTPSDTFFVFCPQANLLKKAKITPEILARSLSILSKSHNARLKIVVFNKKEDIHIAQELKNRIKNAEIVVPRNLQEAAHAFFGAKFVISSRYHASLLAISLGLPSLSVSTDPKIIALLNDFFTFVALPPQIFCESENLNSQIAEVIDHHGKNKEKISQRILFSAQKIQNAFKTILTD